MSLLLGDPVGASVEAVPRVPRLVVSVGEHARELHVTAASVNVDNHFIRLLLFAILCSIAIALAPFSPDGECPLWVGSGH